MVGDIIVEWGNALYQDTVDKFIAGQPVADADLRPPGYPLTPLPPSRRCAQNEQAGT